LYTGCSPGCAQVARSGRPVRHDLGVPRTTFDAAYYRRFYVDAPVHRRRAIARLASGVTGLCSWWGLPLRSVLDVGAGPGYWRDWFAEHRPSVRYRSIDVSPYACERYGHVLADIAHAQPRGRYDLVICQGVLQYLDAPRAERAIRHLGGAARGVLYLEVPTTADRDRVVDADATDLDVYWRTGAWYRRRLERHFLELGCGMHASWDVPVRFYELEHGH
jgi:SAM-dependent methyltransferase